MMSNDPIVDARGRVIAPPQAVLEGRPAGPWDTNRGADVRRALAGERPRAAREADTVARMNASHPGASWHFVTHPTVGRILVSVPANESETITPEELEARAIGRKS